MGLDPAPGGRAVRPDDRGVDPDLGPLVAASSTSRTSSSARSSSARRQRNGLWRMATGPVESRATGRQMPPGLPGGARGPLCRAPVSEVRLVSPPGGGQATSTARRCSSALAVQLGDLEPVAGEVAGGVADVGPVHPDLGGAHHPVEPQPVPLLIVRPAVHEPASVEEWAVGGRSAPGWRPQWPGTSMAEPGAVVEVVVGPDAPQLVVEGMHPPGAVEVALARAPGTEVHPTTIRVAPPGCRNEDRPARRSTGALLA